MSVKALIEKKRQGLAHSLPELEGFMKQILDGSAKDYQIASWLMAVYLKGMSEVETIALVEAMWRSGKSLPRDRSKEGYWLDKHSTGGVGDKTSLLLVPLVTSVCDRILGKNFVKIPMISGRSLGHSGGTLDKLESVPGFRVDISTQEATRLLEDSGFLMMGQTADIAPADRIIYALRDATATVESLPLAVGSILSKKLAESLDGLVLDVKFGSGAFFTEVAEAKALGVTMVQVAKKLGVEAKALLTRMDEPLGTSVGASVEIEECWDFLSGGEREAGLNEVTMALARSMIDMASRGAFTPEQIDEELELEISTNRAAEQFKKLFAQQGGNLSNWQQRNESWKRDRKTFHLRATQSGFVERVDARRVALLLQAAGGARPHKEAPFDHDVGIHVFKKQGDKVTLGETLLEVYFRDEKYHENVERLSKECVRVGAVEVTKRPWVAEVLA